MFRRITICIGILTVLTGMILCMAPPSCADTDDFQPLGTQTPAVGDWSNDAEWSLGYAPTASDDAVVDYSEVQGEGEDEMTYYGVAVIGQDAPYGAQAATLTVNQNNTVMLYSGSTLETEGVALQGGYFTQLGGTNTVNGDLSIYSGAMYVAAGGTFDVSGTLGVRGTVTTAGSGSATVLGTGAGSSVTMTGGTLNVGTEVVGGESGTFSFTQSGGTHTVAGALTVGSSTLASGTFTLSGGALTVGTTGNPGSLTIGQRADDASVVTMVLGDGNMGNGSATLTVYGSMELGKTNYGFNHNERVQVEAYDDSTVIINGSGNLSGPGSFWADALYPLHNLVINTSSTETTTLTGNIGADHLTTGDGTFDGTGFCVTLTGSGDAWTQGSGLFIADQVSYVPQSSSTINVEGGTYYTVASGTGTQRVDTYQCVSTGTANDTNYSLQDNLDLEGGTFLLWNWNDATTATLNMNNFDITAKYVSLGYRLLAPSSKVSIVTGGTDATITATDGLYVDHGTTFIIPDGTRLTFSGVGPTTAGTIDVNGTLMLGSSTLKVTVANGGTVKGDGDIKTLVEFEAGSKSAPGNSPGMLTYDGIGNGAIWDGGMGAEWEMWHSTGTPGTDWDLWKFTNGATLTIDESASTTALQFNIIGLDYVDGEWVIVNPNDKINPALSYSWKIIDVDNASQIIGFNLDGSQFDFYVNGSGPVAAPLFWTQGVDGDIYLNYTGSGVPEPATVVALVFGGFLAAWRRLRRKGARAKA